MMGVGALPLRADWRVAGGAEAGAEGALAAGAGLGVAKPQLVRT